MEFSSFIPLLLMLVLFLLKVPIAFSLLISTGVYFIFFNDNMPVEFFIQQVIASTESFTYLAIPFFACAGVVFNYSGITTRLMKLAELFSGHLKGGMGQVNVVLSAMMGGLSGSANADAAMQTKIIVPEMVKLGYSKGFSTVVTAASSCITPIIPPGIILILYAVLANVSIADMFLAGIVPGILLTIALMVTVSIIAKKRNYAASRDKRGTIMEILKQTLQSIWALGLPLGIIMGLRLGVFTPTEAGAVAVLYAVVIGAFIYKELKWKHLPAILIESVLATAGVMFIIAAASAFGSYLTWEQIPMMVSEYLIGNINNPLMFLLVINLLLLVVGCFFEGGAALILLTPILLPAALHMGIDPVHFGIILSLNLTIAGFTPPFGTMMFITTSMARVKLEEYMKESLPFIGVLILVLLIVTYIPQVVLFLPHLTS
jgi:tripartite ATP-independent transporter DctM subunit